MALIAMGFLTLLAGMAQDFGRGRTIRSGHRTSTFNGIYGLDIYSADIDIQVISQALLGYRAAATFLILNRITILRGCYGIMN